MTEFAGLSEGAAERVLLTFAIFLRVGPIVMLFPGLGETSVPVRYKLALSLGLTVYLTPILSFSDEFIQLGASSFSWIIITETTNGLILGIGARLLVLALQTAGSIAAQSTSLSLIMGNTGITPLPALGHLLVLGGLCLAMTIGIHVKLIETLAMTYMILPFNSLPIPTEITRWGIQMTNSAFAIAFTLSAPFVIISVIYNVALGVINRAMPQMLIVFVGAPVITGAGIFLLLLLSPPLLSLWTELLSNYVINPFGGL